ncbi:MAG: deoxyribonuclease IV [Gemmatimonadota bacterium]|nr:deoxyribonuclease IV [Gemmatimonadota bacterium]MDH5758760.1 deoxyribonuclease IV [Gemmatimonadota bacterium]
MNRTFDDELGAHVSTQGGVDLAPGRAREIDSVCLQLFTKQPNRWVEPVVRPEVAEAFARERELHGIAVAGSHDSYLINLASPKPDLWARSLESFEAELRRCAALSLDFLVTHPGNATDGDLDEGIMRNARGVTAALERVGGPTRVLLELTAGSGTSVGGSFERLASIIGEIPGSLRDRVGVCVDTCHAYSAGYDLVNDYEGVWRAFDAVVGRERLGLIHMNDSMHPLGSHKDRHQNLGAGTLGAEPFRRIMRDDALRAVPKILETPKGDDPVAGDLANLGFLRAFRSD